MNNKEIEEFISGMLPEIKLKEKKESGCGYHGSSKDEIRSYTLYWDEYTLNWTTRELAIKGYIFSRISGVINNVIRDEKKV